MCGLSLVGVIALRLVWVFPARYLLVRPGRRPRHGHAPPPAYTFLLGWAGMRGVVTLAAAFVIPEDTEHREVLLLIAFTVVAGTLLIQGLTLPWLARRLHVPSPDPMDDALARATAAPAGLEGRLQASSRSSRSTTCTASIALISSASSSATSPPGSGSAPPPTRRPRASSTPACGWR